MGVIGLRFEINVSFLLCIFEQLNIFYFMTDYFFRSSSTYFYFILKDVIFIY